MCRWFDSAPGHQIQRRNSQGLRRFSLQLASRTIAATRAATCLVNPPRPQTTEEPWRRWSQRSRLPSIYAKPKLSPTGAVMVLPADVAPSWLTALGAGKPRAEPGQSMSLPLLAISLRQSPVHAAARLSTPCTLFAQLAHIARAGLTRQMDAGNGSPANGRCNRGIERAFLPRSGERRLEDSCRKTYAAPAKSNTLNYLARAAKKTTSVAIELGYISRHTHCNDSCRTSAALVSD